MNGQGSNDPVVLDDAKIETMTLDEVNKALLGELPPAAAAEKPGTDEADKSKTPDEKITPDEKTDEPAAPKLKVIEISDEYIANAPEKDRKILQSIKGGTVDERTLKNYVEAQRFVGKREQQAPQQQTPPPAPIPATPESQQAIDSIVTQRMKALYPDYPETPEDLADLNITNPRKAYEILAAEGRVRQAVTKDVQDIAAFVETAPERNQQTINEEIAAIKASITKYGLDEKALGIDLTIDAEGNNELINQLLTVDEAQAIFDPLVCKVHNVGGQTVYDIQPNGLRAKFLSVFGDKIIESAKNSAYNDGQKNALKQRNGIPPSLSTSGIPGKTKVVLAPADVDGINDLETVNKMLKEF